jgi:hypothetical protein
VLRHSGAGTSPSRIPLIGAICGSFLAILLIALIILLLIRDQKTEEEKDDIDETFDQSEMEDWTDFTPVHFEANDFAEYENMLDPEVPVDPFEDDAFDEAGLDSLLPFVQCFAECQPQIQFADSPE